MCNSDRSKSPTQRIGRHAHGVIYIQELQIHKGAVHLADIILHGGHGGHATRDGFLRFLENLYPAGHDILTRLLRIQAGHLCWTYCLSSSSFGYGWRDCRLNIFGNHDLELRAGYNL